MNRIILKNQKGLTLLELMIVVAVLGLIVAIAIPNLARVRLNSNENAMLSDIRALRDALEMYRTMTGDYPNVIDTLVEANPPYLDDRWHRDSIYSSYANPVPLHGYYIGPDTGRSGSANFQDSDDDQNGDQSDGPSKHYAVRFIPAIVGETANKNYCLDSSGNIYEGTGGEPFIEESNYIWSCVGGTVVS